MSKKAIITASAIALFILGVVGFGYYYFNSFQDKVAYISALSWSRITYERERYNATEMHNSCNYEGKNCRIVSRQVARTRTHNTCKSQGVYPDKPIFNECPIRSGNYRDTSEYYYVLLVSNDVKYNHPVSYEFYINLKPEQVWCLRVDMFDVPRGIYTLDKCAV